VGVAVLRSSGRDNI